MRSLFRIAHFWVLAICMLLVEKVSAQSYVTCSIRHWNDYMRGDLELLKEDAFETIRRGVQERNEFAVAVGKRSLGTYLFRTGKPEKSLLYLQDAITYFLKVGDQTLSAETYNEYGNAMLTLNRPAEAEMAYLNSIKSGKRSGDPTAVFLAEINLARASLSLGDTLKSIALAKGYKRKSAFYHKWEAVANAYAVLGQIEQSLGHNDLSVEYFQKSAYFGLRSNAFRIRAQALNNLAIVRYADGYNQMAEKLFLKSLSLRRKSRAVEEINEGMFNLGVFYQEIKNLSKAGQWYDSTAKYALSKELLEDYREAVLSLTDVLETQGKWKEANSCLRNSISDQADLLEKKQRHADYENRQLEGMQAFMNSSISKSETNVPTRIFAWIGLAAMLALVATWAGIKRIKNKIN